METYDEILNRMTDSYASYAGFRPTQQSDIMIRLRVLAGEIFKLRADAEYLKRQIFPTGATGEYLDLHAAERGLSRKTASTSTGAVTFYPVDEEHGDILIPAGTVVCTYGYMRRYATDADVTLAASDDSVTAAVTAAHPGGAYNARPGAVSVIVTPVTGIGQVENVTAISGGADDESDDELRRRVIDSYVDIANGANAAYYRGIALSAPGVYSASVVGRGRGNGTVDVYIGSKGGLVTAEVKNSVQALLNTGRELNVDVLARDPSPVGFSVYIKIKPEAGYDFSDVSASVYDSVNEYVTARGIGKDVLLSDIGELIYHTKGVSDYRFVSGYGSDLYVADSEYPTVNSIRIGELS